MAILSDAWNGRAERQEVAFSDCLIKRCISLRDELAQICFINFQEIFIYLAAMVTRVKATGSLSLQCMGSRAVACSRGIRSLLKLSCSMA